MDPPGSLTYPTDHVVRVVDWQPGEDVDVSAWPKVNVTSVGDMSGIGCGSIVDPADNAVDDTTAFHCARTNTPDNSCVYIPSGTVVNTGASQVNQKAVCMIGDGKTVSIIEKADRAAGAGSISCYGGPALNHCGGTNVLTSIGPILNGGLKGSTSATVSDALAAQVAVGQVVRLASDWPANMFTAAFQSVTQGPSYVYWGQWVEITAKNPLGGGETQLVFANDELQYALEAGNQRVEVVPGGMIDYLHIESLGLRNDVTPNGDPNPFLPSTTNFVGVWWAKRIQIEDVEFGDFWATALNTFGVAGGRIHGNKFGDQMRSGQTNKSGINVAYSERIELSNNFFESPEVAIELQLGACLNVVAYNHMTNTTTPMFNDGIPGLLRGDRSIFFHGDGNCGNLVEGNHMNLAWQYDDFFGSQGPFNLMYANRDATPEKMCDQNSGPDIGNTCELDSECAGSGACINHGQRRGFTVEEFRGATVAYGTTMILNSTMADFSEQDGPGTPIDPQLPELWLEQNLAGGVINATNPLTTLVGNTAGQDSHDCTGVVAPSSFVYTSKPSWWPADDTPGICNFLKGPGDGGIGACGDDFSATLCDLPAKDL